MNNLVSISEFIWYFNSITNNICIKYPLQVKYEIIDKMEKKYPYFKNKVDITLKKGCKCDDPTDKWQITLYVKKRIFFGLIPIKVHIHSKNVKV